MKRFFFVQCLSIGLILIGGLSMLQAAEPVSLRYVDALTLTHLGKGLETPEPYYRADLAAYPFTASEAKRLVFPSGQCIAFRTNSSIVGVQMEAGQINVDIVTPTCAKMGVDLYIRDGREWRYVSSRTPRLGKDPETGRDRRSDPLVLRRNMGSDEKEFLLYLPLFMEVKSLKIGVDENAWIEPMQNPFRHRIVLCGSSVSQGVGASRAGTSWASLITRETGLDILNYSLSGNCTMQEYVGRMLAAIPDVDMFLFDTFNNPTLAKIKSNFDPFVAAIREKYPDTPLVFMSNHRRDVGNYDENYRKYELIKRSLAERKVKELMARDPNVYYIDIWEITGTDGYAQVDGVHPDGLGYYRWAEWLGPKLLDLVKKIGLE